MDLNFSLSFAVLLVLLFSVTSAQHNSRSGSSTPNDGKSPSSTPDNSESPSSIPDNSPLLYTVQPVSQYSCNPYIVGPKQLICALYQQGGLSNHTIRWFRRSNNSGNIEMPINETISSNEDYLISTLSLKDLIGAEGPSDYWCQVGVYGEANSTYESSAVFKVLPPDAYADYPPCTGLSLSQQVSMFAGNGSILMPVGNIETPTIVGPSPLSEQVIAGVAISSFFVALLSLLICISCCVLRSKRKPSTEIDLIHDINEPLQFQTTIDIHGNESTTPSQVLENSDGYVDIGAEEIPPLDHPLRTSLANNTDFAHLQDNAIEIHYHTIDADGMDKSDYTDLRKPPPISPKPRGVKSQLMNGPRAVKKIDGDKLSTEHRKPPPLAEKKKSY